MQVRNKSKGTLLVGGAKVADTFTLRLRGLLGSKPLKDDEGLILVREKSIHTLFMKFAIDVVYVDSEYRVIRADSNVVPWRLGPFVWRAEYIVEVMVGRIADSLTEVGDLLLFEE